MYAPPDMPVFNRFDRSSLVVDLLSGVTTAVVALPLALAFGIASGAGPAAGLYGAVAVGLLAALFGGTPTLISEPTGPMTVVMTAVIANLTALDPENGLALAFLVVSLAGVLQIILGSLRVGRYVTMMPYSVISGFMTGIGVILLVLQIGPLLGSPTPPGGVLGTLSRFPELVAAVRPAELMVAGVTLAVLLLTPASVRKRVPPHLVALLIGSGIAALHFPGDAVRRIGAFSAALPALRLPPLSAAVVPTLLLDALVLAVLGSIDALLTSTIADTLTRTEHDSSKELIGQGIGNLVAGMVGGVAGAGSTMPTVLNIRSGARSATSGLARSLILAAVVFWASPLTAGIPMAVLAAIVCKVGFDILDWSFIRRAHRASREAALIMYSVMVLTVFTDLMVAVAAGLFVANIVTIRRLSEAQAQSVRVITAADDGIRLSDEERLLLRNPEARVLLLSLSGPMIFGVARAIAREHRAISRCDALVLDLSELSLIDVTVALAIENVIAEIGESGRRLLVVIGSRGIPDRLARLGALDGLNPNQIVDNRTEALRRAVHASTAPSVG